MECGKILSLNVVNCKQCVCKVKEMMLDDIGARSEKGLCFMLGFYHYHCITSKMIFRFLIPEVFIGLDAVGY